MRNYAAIKETKIEVGKKYLFELKKYQTCIIQKHKKPYFQRRITFFNENHEYIFNKKHERLRFDCKVVDIRHCVTQKEIRSFIVCENLTFYYYG